MSNYGIAHRQASLSWHGTVVVSEPDTGSGSETSTVAGSSSGALLL